MSRPWPTALAAVLVLGSAGCGPRVYPVEGVVQYDDGSPATTLARGTISLESVADRSNASGEIRPDGTFRVTDPLGKGGVRPGASGWVALPRGGAARRNPPVDPAFGRYETSGLEIAVKEEPT